MASGFVGINLNDIPAVQILEPGVCTVRVNKVAVEISKNTGAKMISLQLQPLDDPSAEIVFERLVLPNDTHTDKAIRFLATRLRAACEAFDVDFSDEGFEADDFLGKEADVLIDIENYQNADKNVVKSYSVA